MGAKFTARDSVATTNKITGAGASYSRAPDGNTMKGMRGSINTAQKRDSSDVLTGKGVGPKREGSVGSKGGAHRANHGAAQATGSMDKSYKATSTAPAGKITSQKVAPSGGGKMESLRGKARTSWER